MQENDSDIVFNSLQELYLRIKPALYARKCEMIRNGYSYITEEDIWNYFKESKWKNSNNLSLHEMVSDVFNCDEVLIDAYLKEKLNQKKQEILSKLEITENAEEKRQLGKELSNVIIALAKIK